MPRFRYCPMCATPLVQRPAGHSTHGVCPQCGFVDWQNAKPCASGLVVRDGNLLLVRRAIEPYKDFWDIPGGFLDRDEHPEAGVRRELLEETGLIVESRSLFDIVTDVYGTPRQGDDPDYTLSLFYLAEPVGGTLAPADDASEVRWFAPDELPPDNEIAFESNRRVIAKLRRYLAAQRSGNAEE